MRKAVRILDGGMGRELERIGAPFRQPEWSALALLEGPDFVVQAHGNFIDAGAQVVSTNSYAVVPFHLGAERFAEQGEELAALAGRLARQAADAAPAKVLVAGSLPPPLGSYRPDLFDPRLAAEILAVLVSGLAPSVDLWLAETQSSIAEVTAARRAIGPTDKPIWFSFSLQDLDGDRVVPRLRSGEAVADAVRIAVTLGAKAVLFNCSQPEVMGAALDTASATVISLGADSVDLGAYANAFAPLAADHKANASLKAIRDDLSPAAYLAWAQQWVERGASLVGGCCGITPAHIAALGQALV
jgi:homocysteine S-methyltransferase